MVGEFRLKCCRSLNSGCSLPGRFVVDAVVVAAAPAHNQTHAFGVRQFPLFGREDHFLTDHARTLIGVAFIDQTRFEGFDQDTQCGAVFFRRLAFVRARIQTRDRGEGGGGIAFRMLSAAHGDDPVVDASARRATDEVRCEGRSLGELLQKS
jgi:hypothetical protein